MPEKFRALYKGDGSRFHAGIPARHLTQDEFDALDETQRALLRGSDLYEVRSEREMSATAAPASSAPAAKKEGE
jgi:hypothetical protein